MIPDWYIPKSDAAEFWTSERCYITELLNTDKSPDVSLAQARVETTVQTQLHCLSDIEEIYIILAGQGIVEIDGVEQQLKVGDQVIIPPSVSQRITNSGDEDLIFYCVCRPRFYPECYVNLEEVV